MVETKTKILNSITFFNSGNLTDNSLNLFNTLGYNTNRQSPFSEKTYRFFKESFLDGNTQFNEEKSLFTEWNYVDLLFQLSEEEMSKQSSLFNTDQVDCTSIKSYLFFVIELKKPFYSRTELSLITREVNRLFPMPVMVLFKYGQLVTLAVINRRSNKQDERKDVLEKVTLIKDINIANPHRAHIEILFDLSFDELKNKHQLTNFDELHNAWQKTLDIKELNKQFYQKLFSWYLWALPQVKFPQIRPEKDKVKEKVHQSESLIRLLTRLLFVWFMKEKGLINPALFDVSKLKTILKDFEGINGNETIYYKAILQNLFFATLNKPITQRKVIDKGFNPKEYGDPLVYRFDDLFLEPENFLLHFKNIPFLNGGLFECLDQKKDKDNPDEIRLDGFSTKKFKQAVLPDKLFFGEYKDIDLSRDYDDKKKNKLTVYGLIDILDQYKFTIEENTPLEEEIALDPELLGKVFENLLAYYNSETETTARKQNGSFYTPREIVNYMVDESLIAYLSNAVIASPDPVGTKQSVVEQRLRDVLSYSENPNPFNPEETHLLIRAIDTCKILDPACGSGAFPMGVLQKMIHILHKLDPKNKIWFNIVVSNFPAYMQEEVKKRLQKENWNYVRKLGVIQRCIYGVDIQPIAVQIAKLRFFISLLVDQTEKPNEPNRGIDPLPNLDFKIITANTLISAPESDIVKIGLFENQTDPFFEEFNRLTGQYFIASMPEDKKELKNKIVKLISKKCNEKIRQIESKYKSTDERVSKALKEKHKTFIDEKNREIELWQSYTNLFKHESVGFFEPRYFFPEVKDGFDIVIANPPYVRQEDIKKYKPLLEKTSYRVYNSTSDLYTYFYELSYNLLAPNCFSCFITSNKWMRAKYGEKLRNFFRTNTKIINLIDFGGHQVFDATVDTNIMLFQKGEPQNGYQLPFVNIEPDFTGENLDNYVRAKQQTIKQYELSDLGWTLADDKVLALKKKIERTGVPLKDWDVKIYRGVTTGFNKAFIIDTPTKERLCKEDMNSVDIIKPILRGRDIEKYYYKWEGLWIIFIPWHFPLHKNISISGSSEKAEKEFKNQYASIYKHLEQYKKELSNRNKEETGVRYEWYTLQRCAATYLDEFEKEKIVWQRVTKQFSFFSAPKGYYILDSMAFFVGENIKYLLGILNSKLIDCYVRTYVHQYADAGFLLSNQYVEKLPIPKISESEQKPFIELVDCILAITKDDDYPRNSAKQLQVKTLEAEIDQMVYKLYDLNKEEIKIVE